MPKTVSTLCLVVLLGACGPRAEREAPPLGPVADEPTTGSEVICTRERRPGSHTKIKVCRSAEQREAERNSTQRTLRPGTGAAPAGE